MKKKNTISDQSKFCERMRQFGSNITNTRSNLDLPKDNKHGTKRTLGGHIISTCL